MYQVSGARKVGVIASRGRSEITSAIVASPYPIEVLAANDAAAAACLATLGMTSKSWLGALVAHCGGLLVDHGWLRVLGSGHGALPDVVAVADAAGQRLIVGYDVMGGQFGWFQAQPGAKPTVHYFGPDELNWQDLDQGYADWLYGVIAGSLTEFYRTLRWPGWEREIEHLEYDQGITVYPPPWSVEGRDVGAATRRPVPLTQLVAYYEETARQLGPADGGH